MNTRIMFKYIERIRCKYIVQCIIFLFMFMSYTQTDTIPAYHYFIKADSLLTQRKLDSADVYFKKAIPIYEKAKAWEQVATCYNRISECQRRNDMYEESFVSAKKALKICELHLSKSNKEVAFAYDNIGDYYYLKNKDLNNALKYYQKALKVKQKIFPDNNLDIAISYLSIGNTFLLRENFRGYDKALYFYEKALKIREKQLGKNHIKISGPSFCVGLAYDRKQEYNKALPYMKKALFVMSKADMLNKDPIEIARFNRGIGRLYQKDRQDYKAIPYLEKNLFVLEDVYGKNNSKLIQSFTLLGISYRNIGEYDRAIYYYNEAIKTQDGTFETKKNISHIYNNLGIIFKDIGEYDKAMNYYKNALNDNLKIKGEDNLGTAIYYNNIGNIYRFRKEYDKSIFYIKKALELKIKILTANSFYVADAYNDLGNVFYAKKEYKEAVKNYQKALNIRVNIFGNNGLYISESYISLGNVNMDKLNYGLALKNYQKALTIRQGVFGEHHPKVSLSFINLAEVYFEQNNFKNALINYQKAITANIVSNTEDQYFNNSILFSTLKGQAKTYQALYQENNDVNNLNQAIKTYQKADTIINQIRQSFTNYQDKVTFAKTAKEVYQGAIATQLLRYDIKKDPKSLEQAFYYAERSKANILKELLNDANAKNFTGLPKEVLALEKELRIDHAFYQSTIVKERSKQDIDSSKITNYESRLFDISRRQDSLTEVLENNYPKYYQLKHENKLITLAGIQKQLPKNKTLVEFFTSDSITYAFTISKNTLSVEELAIPKLEKQVEKFRKAVLSKDIKNYKTVGYDLYTQLIAPIKDQLVAQELIIIPDGPLWHLNFELLLTHDDNSNNPKELSYLLKEYAISYGNSANLLLNTSNNNQKTKKREECLAFSFSDSTKVIDANSMSLATLRDAGDDLPGTRKEIKAISEIIDGQYYYGSEAIEANFKKNAGQFNILHLALHGEVDNERPENSKLYFTKSKDTIEDNLLYGHELFALDIPAELTVLSACNTGSGKIAKGEGIMSLGSAFQYAGTKSLLLSSWEVSDQTTPELMRYFYRNLKEGMNKAKALQQAKLQYLQTANINRTHPFYWGGFYLVGDAASIRFDDNSILYWILGILFLIVLSGGLFWYRKIKS